MTRNGKIARLPRKVRVELNHRLDDGEEGKKVVSWLNDQEEVMEMVEIHFEGRAITEQNLSEWKKGGYLEWQRQQEEREFARSLTEQAANLKDEAGLSPLSDNLAPILALTLGKLLAALAKTDFEDPAQRQSLAMLAKEVSKLRNDDHKAARLRIELEDREEQQKKALKKAKDKEHHNHIWEHIHILQKMQIRELALRPFLPFLPPDVEAEIRERMGLKSRESSPGNLEIALTQIPPDPSESE